MDQESIRQYIIGNSINSYNNSDFITNSEKDLANNLQKR